MTIILSPLIAVLASILLTLPLALDGIISVVYLFFFGPLFFLLVGSGWLYLAIQTAGVRRFSHVLALLLLFPLPAAAIAFPKTAMMTMHDAEDHIAWRFAAEKYRVPSKMNTDVGLPHAFWRSWGFLSVWTEAYLVFDEADALGSFAFGGGEIPGVPCGAWHVLPLQKQWYVVTLYSEQTWDVCGRENVR